MASFGDFFNLSFFSFPQEEEKMKQMNTLNIFDFINNKYTKKLGIFNYSRDHSTLIKSTKTSWSSP